MTPTRHRKATRHQGRPAQYQQAGLNIYQTPRGSGWHRDSDDAHCGRWHASEKPGRRPGSHSGRHRCRDASRSPQWASSLSRCHPHPTGCLVYIKAGLLVLCRSALMSCCLAVTCGGHCWLSSSAAAWCLERRSFLVVSLLLVSFSSLRSISLRSLSMTLYSR